MQEKLFTTQFYLLCLSSVLFMGSFNMIVPELPNYLTQLGGGDYKGLIISLFTVSAGLSRPFSGRMADRIGRLPVMIVGSVVSLLCSLVYPFVAGIFGFFLLRFLHGFSTGFKPTGTTSYLADIVPIKRRGEAMGILGVSGSAGMAAGPAIGSWIAMQYSLETMFYISAFISFLSVLVIAGMKESLEKPVSFHLDLFKIGPKDVLDFGVIAPSIVMMLAVFSFGSALTIVPDFSDYLQVSNRGYFFSVMLFFSIIVRVFAGKASDKYGRVHLLIAGTAILCIGMIVTAFAETQFMFMLGASIFGISVGINSPTIFAWTVDLAKEETRGRAISTMFIALEIGIGLGAFFSGYLYNNQSENFKYCFLLCAILAFIAFAYLIIRKITQKVY